MLSRYQGCTCSAGTRVVHALQVPAYFDEDQRYATITAGKIAGLETIKLIRQVLITSLPAYWISAA